MPYIIDPRRGRRLVAMMLVGCFFLAAPAAQAEEPSASSRCATPEWKHPFIPWFDSGTYTLSTGADMESGTTNWSLSGGAAIVSGNEPFHVGGLKDANSLSIPSGASATSPVMCVGKNYPFFRFFQRNTGNLRSSLNVEVLYLDADGKQQSVSVANQRANTSLWLPTQRIAVGVGLTGSSSTGDMAPIAFRFTADGKGGEWSIDDLYVDPWARG